MEITKDLKKTWKTLSKTRVGTEAPLTRMPYFHFIVAQVATGVMTQSVESQLSSVYVLTNNATTTKD
jgi:hypothetical protein